MIKSFFHSKHFLMYVLIISFLTIFSVVSSFSLSASKKNKVFTYKNGLQYQLKKSIFGETALIVDYKGKASVLTIPNKIGKYYVEEIGLDGNEITSLRKVIVYAHTKLTELCIDECDVNSLTIVNKINHLKYFSLENSRYKKIYGLDNIKEVDYMWIERNLISDKFILNTKINKQLIANENDLKAVEIRKSKNLKEINLANNRISDLYIECQSSVEILNLKNNKLKSINTSKMKNLKYLNIKGNNGIKYNVSKNKKLIQLVK